MSASATLMAVLTIASIPLGPLYVVVGVDIGWPPIGALVRVRMVNNLIINPCLNIAVLFFPDIDECILNTDGCVHICTNTIGSYTCSCRTGYRLSSNGHSCQGTPELP
jgi:hypothetical protein